MVATPPLDLAIRMCEEQDLELLAALWSEAQPDSALTVEELRHEDELAPQGRRFVAWLEDEPVGAGVCAALASRPTHFEGAWTTVMVREGWRCRGIGAGLLEVVAAHARAMGKAAMYTFVGADHPEALRFLRRHGYVEWDRARCSALVVCGPRRVAAEPPPGVRITTLAEAPLLGRGLHDVAVEAYPDIPVADPLEVPPYPQWRAQALDSPQTPHEACFVAVHGREVVGWANLELPGARPGVAYHAMTVVRPAWRGRGIARALKQASIAWAVTNGCDVLETENAEANAAMLAVNARLGYRPLPDRVLMRSPLPAA